MKLKEDLEVDEDFILVSQSTWQKLIRFFGGAPEIGFFLVDKNLIQKNNEAEVQEGDKILKD